MERSQLEHLIRAAAAITGETRFVIVGSQAILGALPMSPAELLQSMEADMWPADRPELADLIEGSIGEGSPFEATWGYYAQGISPQTPVLPLGWEGRLHEIRNANTGGASGYCIDPHDLFLSKAVAGREKDILFIEAMARHGLVERSVLESRLRLLPAAASDPGRIGRVAALIARTWERGSAVR